jgi:hypothetical protein
MPFRKASLLAAFAVSAFLAAAPADARRTVIDTGEFIDIGSPVDACTIGGDPCDATILPFSFDFGTGLTNEAFIYDRGIISFGDPISGAVDPNADFTTFGVPVIAPLYVPGDTGTAGPYDAFAGTIGAGDFEETLANFGTDLFVISFLDPSVDDPNDFLTPYVHVIIDASTGEIRFEFIHGQSFKDEFGNVTLALPNTTGTQMGYVLGNEQLLVNSPNTEGINAFTFPGGGGGVPEPATWAMMLLGFGAVGFSMRRARTSAARTLAAA